MNKFRFVERLEIDIANQNQIVDLQYVCNTLSQQVNNNKIKSINPRTFIYRAYTYFCIHNIITITHAKYC